MKPLPPTVRWGLRWAARLAAAAAVLGAAVVGGFTLYAVGALSPLQDWHTERLASEFSATRHADLDFDGYLRLEAQLFDELRRAAVAWRRSDEAFVDSRFNPDGMPLRLAGGAPFNRSYRLPVAQPAGHALLIHGLTDSPYTMKAMAEALQRQGIDVTVLRLPGHGTLPSMMTSMSLDDWTAAVRIAARHVATRAGPEQPFYLGGYSTGGTLALLHTVRGLDDPSVRRPDRLLLLSPAIRLTPVVALADFIDLLSVVPVPLLEKVRWQEVVAEFDPYRFNSFPVNAARQVNHATRALDAALAQAGAEGRLSRMPPVVTWQSVVDSTVGAVGAVDSLHARLPGPAHRLVMFDVNRLPALRTVHRPAARELIDRLLASPRSYQLDVVTQLDGQGPRVSVLRVAPDGTQRVEATALDWPAGVVSVGHVALPFENDDPVYGLVHDATGPNLPSIGSWLLRGEPGATTVSLGSLTRLRSNPFWPLIEDDLAALVASDLRAAAR